MRAETMKEHEALTIVHIAEWHRADDGTPAEYVVEIWERVNAVPNKSCFLSRANAERYAEGLAKLYACNVERDYR